MIRYQTTLDGITPEILNGFFEGWPNPPTPQKLFSLLKASAVCALAVDDESNQVVGFTYAVSDRALSAYIPLLEVLPAYRRRGIGSELVRQILAQLENYYMIDLVCDSDVQPFYRELGFVPAWAMIRRNYLRQSGDGETGSGRNLRDLTDEMDRFVRSKGWYAPESLRPQTPRNLAISLSLEAAEVLEHYQWRETSPDREELAGELADVMLYLLQLARQEGIDLEEAVMKKLEKNYTRQWDTRKEG